MNPRSPRRSVLVLALLFGAAPTACGGAAAQGRVPTVGADIATTGGAIPAGSDPSLRGAHECPLGVPSVMTIDDTPDGATFTFTTADPAQVAELRRRAHDSAAMYGAGARRGLGHDGTHGRGHRHGLALSELLPLETVVEDVPAGARLHVAALDPARAPELQEKLHERAEIVASGECP